MNRMCKFVLCVAGWCLLWAAGCTQTGVVPTPQQQTPTIAVLTLTASPTSTLELTTATLTPTDTLTPTRPVPTPTASPGTVFPPNEIMDYKPVTFLPSLPQDAKPEGVLVLGGEGSFLVHFEHPLRLEPVEFGIGLFTVSQDGQWLAYLSGNRQLTVESADRQLKNTIWLEYYLSFGGWINAHQLEFNYEKDIGGVIPVVMVDPFSGKHLHMPSDYPGIAGSYCGPRGTMQFQSASMVFDPSLELVVYPEMSNPAYIVLWDIQAQKALAKIEEDICFGNYPEWSPDGNRFVVASLNKKSLQAHRLVEEWVSVTREGEVEWLTHFADFFEEVEIDGADWSPDNRHVAFWLETRPDLCPNPSQVGERLAVLDIETYKATIYCFSGEMVNYYSLIANWSLDGRYASIQGYKDELGYTFLINFEQGWVSQIAEGLIPVGWIRESP